MTGSCPARFEDRKMKETGLIFTSESVRAILANRKTQTRRVVKPQPYKEDYSKPTLQDGLWVFPSEVRYPMKISCPYGKVGNRLYCREPYRVCNRDYDNQQSVMVHYYGDRSFKSIRLTNEEWDLWIHRKKPFMKTSGRFMYKSLARIWLEITGIRVERVQDITIAGMTAEGIEPPPLVGDDADEILENGKILMKNRWIKLWDSINAKRGYGWEINTYVWVIEFKRFEKG